VSTDGLHASFGQLERELAYYRRECNDLGGRLLRLQEEQSQAFREARRSRTVAKLIREAYRLADQERTPDEIGKPMLEIIVENALCDGAALLHEEPGEHAGWFRVTHAIGPGSEAVPSLVQIPSLPAFFFTTSRTAIEPPAYELTGILRLPYVLWAYDRPSGRALILGNRSESNVSRPFEAGDLELVEGALSVYIDVLLRKQAEMELRDAKAAAERSSVARARFLSVLTHELRTPLNAVIGYSEMMAPGSRYKLTLSQRQDYALQILDAGQHLLALVNGILDYSSLEQALPSLTPKWLCVEQVLRDAVSIATGAGRHLVEVRVVQRDRSLEINVDSLRFRQILHNLLGNAVRFSPAGSVVEVEAQRDGDALTITVRDRGIGMRPEDIPRALEPFQQLDNGQPRGPGSTGLGLPIAKALVEAHDGRLSIASALGEGTSVQVLLPAARVRTSERG
jgi:signal transduction histidine kinase